MNVTDTAHAAANKTIPLSGGELVEDTLFCYSNTTYNGENEAEARSMWLDSKCCNLTTAGADGDTTKHARNQIHVCNAKRSQTNHTGAKREVGIDAKRTDTFMTMTNNSIEHERVINAFKSFNSKCYGAKGTTMAIISSAPLCDKISKF